MQGGIYGEGGEGGFGTGSTGGVGDERPRSDFADESPLVEPWWQEELAYIAAGFVTNLVLASLVRGVRALTRRPVLVGAGVLAVVGGAAAAAVKRRRREGMH